VVRQQLCKYVDEHLELLAPFMTQEDEVCQKKYSRRIFMLKLKRLLDTYVDRSGMRRDRVYMNLTYLFAAAKWLNCHFVVQSEVREIVGVAFVYKTFKYA
jgi:hypothetical protein